MVLERGPNDKPRRTPAAEAARKTFLRSASWSVHSPSTSDRPLGSKPRFGLPPLSIARPAILAEWPDPASDDLADSTHLCTPRPAAPGPECSKIADHIYLGGDSAARSRETLDRHGITHVLNCVGFVCPEYFKPDLVYKTLWLHDSPSEDITSVLYDVFDYFEDVRAIGGRVLVHCCKGISRSTSLVIAYLMWLNCQSFDEAFQYVKAARGVTNPNLGFAGQLLQCQKRVHAVPVSPASALRMYRMAPHSPYDPLHLVPKMVSPPCPQALDSRGAFLVQIPSAIYVWIGAKCDLVIERNASGAAFQVARYERVEGSVIRIEEGEEPDEFWEVLGGGADLEVEVGKRKVELYNVDYEIFEKAVRGGVVPSFPGTAGSETRLPMMENGWSLLRRKFASGTMKEFARGRNQIMSDHLIEEEGTSVPCSPDSLAGVSSRSSKSSCSTASSFSPGSSSCSEFFFLPSGSPSSISGKSPLSCKENTSLSIAQRRGTLAPSLELFSSDDGTSPVSRSLGRAWSFSGPLLAEDTMRGISSYELEFIGFHESSRSEKAQDSDLLEGDQEMQDCITEYPPSNHLMGEIEDSNRPKLFAWPNMREIKILSGGFLDQSSVFLLLAPDVDSIKHKGKTLFVWVGRDVSFERRQSFYVGRSETDEDGNIYWEKVGSNFLYQMGLPAAIPIQIVREEQETQEFLAHLRFFSSHQAEENHLYLTR